jgi:hypothetical protein
MNQTSDGDYCIAAILPWETADKLFDRPAAQTIPRPAPEERCVRGSLVTGFSRVDVELLDVFEGDVSPPNPNPHPTPSTKNS